MEKILAVTPAHAVAPQIAIAACRAGALGILDLGLRSQSSARAVAVEQLARDAGLSGRWGVRWDTLGADSRNPDGLAELLPARVPVLVLAGVAEADLRRAKAGGARVAEQVILEVYDAREALAAQQAGYDGVIVKGHEAGGRVSRDSSYILLQRLHERLSVPYWIQGGIDRHTIDAAFLAGATGVVLCEQLWLTDEAPFSAAQRSVWSQFDGSETIVIGHNDTPFRLFSRSGRDQVRTLERLAVGQDDWRSALVEQLLREDPDPLIPVGEDLAFAKALAQTYGTVGRTIRGLRASIGTHLALARSHQPFAPGAALARQHGTEYPVVQGPMTRVSDVVPFAKAVAEGGGLPFFALAVLRQPQVRQLLVDAKARLGDLPWGIGLLGFVPAALRQEQLEVVKDIRPPFALIAGGRPSQARELEELGISTYLHAPSPGLLRLFIAEGARKFVFEGSECGGHVGPRTSFVLWSCIVDELLSTPIDSPEELQVLFAGGIHDPLSAAMVASVAAPLTAQGIKVGVLMGSAYLFTEEIVSSGALLTEYQDQALACERTGLLQSGPGYFTRAAITGFFDEFTRARHEMVQEGKSDEEILEALERLNVGRLRLASKGIVRRAETDGPDEGDAHGQVDTATQRRDGMYMLGDLATLRRATTSIADLHAAVSVGSTDVLDQASSRTIVRAQFGRSNPDVAIVGMACLFPKAPDLRSFWDNILRRVDAIREVSDDRWRPAVFHDPDPAVADMIYAKWGGFLDDVPFDPTAYGIPPASVESIEPMQLLALEVTDAALKDAGFDAPAAVRERTAVIFGYGGIQDRCCDYVFRTLLKHYLPRVQGLSKDTHDDIIHQLYEQLPKWTGDSFPGILGNVVAGRVSNRFDLLGSNFVVDAACASSLAALDVGLKQLQTGEADVAVVGAVDGTNSAMAYMSFAKVHALSPRGRCRPFDDQADGIAISEGVAALVLKRVDDAERDGDRIYALIKGIGSSSDGRNRSLTAPHPEGQARALRRAYEQADLAPDTVELVEAHGTGTAVGDKAEVEALSAVFGRADGERQYCALGSVKSMIGHTKVASGLAGLIKGALALKHKLLPPTIGVDTPNTRVDFAQTPFYVNTETRPWFGHHSEHPRRCGVSAFGFGGTNFHLVMEEYGGDDPVAERLDYSSRAAEIFAFRGADRSALHETAQRLLKGVTQAAGVDLAELAYAVHRQEFDETSARQRDGSSLDPEQQGSGRCRLAIVATSVADLREKLQQAVQALADRADPGGFAGVYYGEGEDATGRVCFLFPGQGAQQVNMLRELVVAMPWVYSSFERADALLTDQLPTALSRTIYPVPAFTEAERQEQQDALSATEVAQPSLGVVDLAALDILSHFGLRPDFVAGHSYGEYVALCAAGVLSRDDLIQVSAIRGRLSAAVSDNVPGTLAAVQADAQTTEELIERFGLGVSLASLNAPDQTIIGGASSDIEQAVTVLRRRGWSAQQLPVTAAFHTPAMADAARALQKALEDTTLHPPALPVYSNTTAALYPQAVPEMHDILARHLVQPVRFAEQIEQLHGDGARIFIECGPGRSLTGLVRRILADRPHTALPLDSPGQPGWLPLAQLLAHAWVLGTPADIGRWFDHRDLAACAPDELFARARELANPAPTVWRVNGNRTRPWQEADTLSTAPRRSGRAPERDTVPAASDASPESLDNVDTSRSEPSMTPDDTEQAARPPDGAVGVVPSDPVLAQLQANTTRLIALLQGQQQLVQQLLQMQQRLLSAVLRQPAGQEVMPAQALPVDAAPPAPTLAPLAVTPSAPSMGGPVEEHQPPVPAGADAPAQRPDAPAYPPDAATYPPDAATQPPDATTQPPDAATRPPDATTQPPDAATQPPDAATRPADTATFQALLLRTVSEQTGYPEAMLDLDAHIETDLGIDSLKRIEILVALKEHLNLSEGQAEETALDELATLKHLRQIVEWYDKNRLRTDATAQPAGEQQSRDSLDPADALDPTESDVSPETNGVHRYAVTSVRSTAGEGIAPLDFPSRHLMLILGDIPPLSAALQATLEQNGYGFRQLLPGKQTRALRDNRFEADLSSEESLRLLHGLLTESGQRIVGGVINLLALDGLTGERRAAHLDDAKNLFFLLQMLEDDLRTSAGDGGGWLINVTAMDGHFGLRAPRDFPIGTAGTLGVVKSVAREWPHLRVKCIDVDSTSDPSVLVGQLADELRTPDPAVEVGLAATKRWTVDVQPRELPVEAGARLDLGPESVLLVTGGARGITAEVTKGLVGAYRPHVILVGRRPLPAEEPPKMRSLRDADALRRWLIETSRNNGAPVTPAEIERRLTDILHDRQVRTNLDLLRQSGTVEYHAVDVRDAAAFGALIDTIYDRRGRIDGVLHGAGVIDDRRIADKGRESFSSVFDTKVTAALVLAEKLRPERLKWLMFFSSVAGRFGNAGQADYSAANEVLNKLADQLHHAWPGVHTVAVNWGPWDAGMVPPELRRAYDERGMTLIPTATGVRYALAELRHGRTDAAEVIVAGGVQHFAEPARA